MTTGLGFLDQASDHDFLDAFGPCWSRMSPAQREAYGPAPDLLRRPLRTSALKAWHRALAAGKRTATMFDAPWRAACYERSALEAAGLGLQAHAGQLCTEADAILRRRREVQPRHETLARDTKPAEAPAAEPPIIMAKPLRAERRLRGGLGV
ncbi:MAG: hypothetical protein ACT4PM_10375 [Gemmatimonadales bacterium]